MADLQERIDAALGDHYAIESEIGRGGMAVVLLAEDLKHHRQVAIKVLHPELTATLGAERFLQEIEIIARLQHPHILPLHDSGEADGLLYFVMPYVEGESLRQRLDWERQLAVDESVRIAIEVADGLDYAHRQGVVHRDIKPGNILLSDRHAVIADFGIARAVETARQERITRTGLGVGTPLYASPEQATAEETLDGRADIYALGCVLYEMLAGEPPLAGSTPEMIRARRLVETPTPLSSLRDTVPPALDRVIGRALAKVPADRYATAAQFGRALQAIPLAPAPSYEAGSSGQGRSPSSRRLGQARIGRVGLVVAVALTGMGAGLWIIGGQEGREEGIHQATKPNAAEMRQIQLTFVGDVIDAEISPNGEQVAYCRSPDGPLPRIEGGQGASVALVRVSEPEAKRKLASIDSCFWITWTPNGSAVILGGEVKGRPGTYVLSQYGGSPRTVSCGGSNPSFEPPAISPDGARCAYRIPGFNAHHVLIESLDGMRPVDTIEVSGDYDNIAAVDWLPAGERLAVETVDGVGTGTVWTVNLDGKDRRQVLTVDGDFTWRWSRDGRALFYQLYDAEGVTDLMSLPVTREGDPAGVAVWLMQDGSLRPSLDRRRVAATRRSARTRIVRILADPAAGPTASRIEPVVDWTEGRLRMSLSHDGIWVAYASREGLFKTPVPRGPAVRLGAEPVTPIWSPDDRFLLYHSEWQDTLRLWLLPTEVGGLPAMIEGFDFTSQLDGADAAIFASGWFDAGILLQVQSLRNAWVLDSLRAWSIERGGWVPISDVEASDIHWGRGIKPSGRWLVANDSVGKIFHSPRMTSPDGRLLVSWLRTEDGSHAEGQQLVMGDWLLSPDGSQEMLDTMMSLQALHWAAEGVYTIENSPPGLYLSSPNGGESRLLLLLPESLKRCEVRQEVQPVELVCVEEERSSDAWLIENFDASAG